MATYSIGDKVRLQNSSLTGTVNSIGSDGALVINLDIGGQANVAVDNVTLCQESPERDAKGHFLPGHSYMPINPENKKKKYNARQLRMSMTEKLGPILEHIDELITNIDDPSKQVDALSKMCKYVMPTLSSIDYTENTPRALTEEEQLARFKRLHEQKKAGQ